MHARAICSALFRYASDGRVMIRGIVSIGGADCSTTRTVGIERWSKISSQLDVTIKTGS